MANTYAEKSIDSPKNSQISDIIQNEFGFVWENGYYFSPFDTKFGIKVEGAGSSAVNLIYFTLDDGKTKQELCGGTTTANNTITSFSYQLSENKRVIYIRLAYDKCTTDHIFAYDENDNAVHIIPRYGDAITRQYYTIMHHTNANNIMTADECGYSKTNANLPNAVYKYPSLMTGCMFKELYAVVNVQSYPSTSSTYVNFSGKIFRIVECEHLNSQYSGIYHRPYFAFPVGDA